MIRYKKYAAALMTVLFIAGSCTKPDYSLDQPLAPSDVTITTTIVGQDADHPNGDGSGKVDVVVIGKGVIEYGIDYDAANGIGLIHNPTGISQKKFSKAGVNTYTITAVAYGSGAAQTVVTTDVTVETIFTLDPVIEATVVGETGSRTWKVDGNKPGHLGVGPWSATNVTPEWWAAAPNEKAEVAPCLYSSRFTFAKDAVTGAYTLTVSTPDGAFTKTGTNAGGLPGIPSTGDEGCYTYGGGSSSFSFVPPGSGVDESNSTLTAIELDGTNTYIGYGAQLKEYEILSYTENTLYLRAQGTETGNAWYVKLVAE